MPHREQSGLLDKRYLPYLWTACLLVPLAHFLLIRYGPQDFPFNLLNIALGLIKIAVGFFWFKRLANSPIRFRWLLLIAGAAMSNISTQMYFWHYAFANEAFYLSGPASFLTTAATIPCLLAIASNFYGRQPHLVVVIDLCLSLMLGALFVLQIHAAMDLQPVSEQASALAISRLIDFQNVFLIVCAVLQFLAADYVEDRRFFYVFLGYMVFATPVLSVRNRMAALYPTPLWDVGLDASPLIFLLLATGPMPSWVRNLRPSARFVPLLRSGSPVFISLALTLLGLAVLRSNFYFGTAGILTGMIGYGLRSTIIQGRLLETEERLKAARDELEVQVSRDGLTGIPNRRFLDETLQRQWRVCVREGRSFAILMIDIDHFKSLNDTYGHENGDACLIAVARTIQNMLPRAGDFVGRYGGEEFAACLPETGMEGALVVAEKLRSGIESLEIPTTGSSTGRVTVSIGVAAGDAASVQDMRVMLKAADNALYLAKRTGRNRVEASDLTASEDILLPQTQVSSEVPPRSFGHQAPL